jgi:uncharacterized protein (AIM24 family)
MSHLTSAGELMAGRHFRQAEVELLRALSTTPTDVRALNLLALVRFKLGKLEEARTTYREIADLLPGDAGIQRNFGLVSLKMERYEDAVAALERATRLAPDDKRAWSYLGYALVKNGDSTGAALAFRRGGQDLLAAQLEPVVVADAASVETSKVAVATSGVAPAAEVAPEPVVEEASVVEPRSSSVTVTPGLAPAAYVANAEVVNSLVPLAAAPALDDSQTVSLVSFVLAGMGMGAVAALDHPISLVVEDDAYVRSDAALAWTGTAPSLPAYRRVRGRPTDVLLGSKGRGFSRLPGSGELWVAGRPGRWLIVSLDDDIFYLREDRVLAFDRSVSWEAGRVPGDGLRLLQFRGTGRVALQFAQPPSAIRVTADHPVAVPRSRLYGWVGRIVAHGLRRAERLFQIHCEGEGVILLDVARSARHHPVERARPV